MGMSEFYGSRVNAESIATIKLALDLGVSFLDTADAYGPHTNEELVGRAIRGRRHDVFLATKFGLLRSADPAFRGVCGRPDHVRSSCEGSLRRLSVDAIDLYYLHRLDPEIPIEETVGAMAGLVQEGKVRYLGLSEVGPLTLRRAQAIHEITALQSEYSLWTRDPETEVLPTCRELGIGFVAYSPLGRGFLTGRIRSMAYLPDNDYRHTTPRFQDENFRKNLALLAPIEEIAKEKGCLPGQLALAWVLVQGKDVLPIFGTKRRKYLTENLASLDIELTGEDLRRIEERLPPRIASGARYPEGALRLLGD